MKKKIIAIGLITTMVVCNSMTVWAADTWTGSDGTGTYNIKTDGNNADNKTTDNQGGIKNVKGTYNLEDTQKDTYNVEISWGDLTYKMGTATAATTGTWTVDSDTGEGYYTIAGFPGWIPNGSNEIIVTNKSNVAITATFTGNIDPSLVGAGYTIETGTIGFAQGTLNDSTFASDILTIESNVQKATPPSGSSTATITGAALTKAPTLKNESGLTLGTVTVRIDKQQ